MRAHFHTMKKLLLLSLLLPFSCRFSQNGQDSYTSIPYWTEEAELRSDALGLRLFAELAGETAGNVVFSPAGAEALLGMLKNGSRGKTLSEMQKLPPMGESGGKSAMQPHSAQALFLVDERVEPRAGALPGVQLHRVPESTALRSINSWVKKQTGGNITAALGELPLDTALVPVSAVYMDEKWAMPFGTNNTRQEDFHLAGGKTVQVPMMHRRTALCRYAEGPDWQAVALFYRRDARAGEPGCFIGILPRGDARSFARSLTPAKWRQIRQALRQTTPELNDVALPRFSTRTVYMDLSPALKRMGMQTAFSRNTGDDFSPLASVPPGHFLYVGKIQQVACVKMNEEGTEAAAASTATFSLGCSVHAAPQPVHCIRFDKPFVWAVTDLSGNAAPWFLGLTAEP